MALRRQMMTAAVFVLLACASSWTAAQTKGEREEFTAVAIQNDEVGSGAGIVLIQITRWSTDAERERFVTTIQKKGPQALLDVLRDSRSVGTIRTPDSLGYDLRYAQETPLPDGGRQIVIATDRPLGFWESWYRPRSADYPFTVIQMQMGPDGNGKGTMSYAAKIRATRRSIELENFSTSPIMLTQIESRKR